MPENKANISRAHSNADVSECGPNCAGDADQCEYIADMILELQQMAARLGNHSLAKTLLEAHQLARRS